jgi:hypothetical protein
LLKGTLAWFLIVGIMGLGESIGSRRAQESSANQQGQELDRRPTLITRAAQYLSRATLPIYTLHLTFVVVIGFYVVQWTSNMWVRFLAITIVSMLGTLAAYDIVRRTRLTRFLFGMRTRDTRISPPGAEQRDVGGWVSANLPHLGLWVTAALFTVLVVIAANNASLVGRWEQTLDTIQPATGYIAEFRTDGTWTVTAEGESIDGSYELIEDDQIKIIYADGTTAVAGYRISYDRFGLINIEGERQQIFMRIP